MRVTTGWRSPATWRKPDGALAFSRSAPKKAAALCTEELTRPGFLHNVHANYHTLVGICPVYDDLELITRHGLRYVQPPVQMASVFQDGTALVVHTDLDKTCESIARFSRKDADTFRAVYEEARGYRDLILRTLMYSPPTSIMDITKALVTWGVEEKSKYLSVHLRHQTINEFLDHHFENDRVKAHLSFHAALAGYATDRRGLAVSFPLLLSKIDNWHICIGGSHALAHSLWEALAQAGGRVFLNHGVEKILVENGKAVGVRLEDGSEVRARHLVASSISLEQTFFQLVGRENLPAAAGCRSRALPAHGLVLLQRASGDDASCPIIAQRHSIPMSTGPGWSTSVTKIRSSSMTIGAMCAPANF